jgi:hypothetical protein
MSVGASACHRLMPTAEMAATVVMVEIAVVPVGVVADA